MMMDRLKKINLVRWMIIVLTIKTLLTTSLIIPWTSWMDGSCTVFAIIVFALKLYQDKDQLLQDRWLSALGIGIVLTCLVLRSYNLMLTFMTVYLLQGRPFDKYVRLILRLEVALIAFHLLISGGMSILGSGEAFWIVTDTRLRFTGGFNHPNILSTYLLSCMLMYIWLHFDHLSKMDAAMFIGITLFSFVTSKSRTGLLINVMVLLVLYFFRHPLERFPVQRYLKQFLPYLFPILMVLNILAMVIFPYHWSLIDFVDGLFSGRIRLGAYALARSGIAILPRYLNYASTGLVTWDWTWQMNTFTFDNLYSFCWVQLGLIWIMLLGYLIARLIAQTDTKVHVFILVWLLYSLTEVHGLNVYQFFPALCMTFLFDHRGGESPWQNPPSALLSRFITQLRSYQNALKAFLTNHSPHSKSSS